MLRSRNHDGPFDIFANDTKRPVKYATFKEQMDEICSALRVCDPDPYTACTKICQFTKTICKHLLEPDYRVKLVDNPLGVKTRVANNKNVNLKKKEKAILGKEALEKIKGEEPAFASVSQTKRGRKRKAEEETIFEGANDFEEALAALPPDYNPVQPGF